MWPWVATLLGLVAVGATLLALAKDDTGGAFHVPTEKERRAAIGDTSALRPPLRRAFDPGDDFAPIPEPGPRDWLAHFPEKGQTWAEYVGAAPNRPDEARSAVHLQPIGTFDADAAPSLDVLARFAEAFFALPVRVREPLRVNALGITARTNRHTKKPQLRTGDILRALRERLPDDAFCLLGVTMHDLYPGPTWNFVFGQASFRERVGVYSFVRYDPRFHGLEDTPDRPSLVLRRSCKVLAHEAGHMFGMHHCIHFCCLMNGSNHLEESDSRPLHLCPVCLRKLHHAVEFDPADRYARLLAFARSATFEDEAQWLAGRLAHVRDQAGSSREVSNPSRR